MYRRCMSALLSELTKTISALPGSKPLNASTSEGTKLTQSARPCMRCICPTANGAMLGTRRGQPDFRGLGCVKNKERVLPACGFGGDGGGGGVAAVG